ncbi:MAG: hypothetical protein WBX08_18510, partial [Candidatus Sulfotelmatobacter sp.]
MTASTFVMIVFLELESASGACWTSRIGRCQYYPSNRRTAQIFNPLHLKLARLSAIAAIGAKSAEPNSARAHSIVN